MSVDDGIGVTQNSLYALFGIIDGLLLGFIAGVAVTWKIMKEKK